MKYNNDYDFDRFYADVNGCDYESEFRFYTPREMSYDTYTGANEDSYYYWN